MTAQTNALPFSLDRSAVVPPSKSTFIDRYGNTLLGDDAVAFRLSRLIEDDVILRNYDDQPTRWILVAADYQDLFQHVAVDENKLESGIVDLTIT